MTVRVRPLNILAQSGLSAVTQFADTFNRASGELGQNWIQTVNPFIPNLDPVDSSVFSIGALADLAQGVIVTRVGTTNSGENWGCGLLCAPIYMTNWGKSQFSEWKLISITKNLGQEVICGPSVLTQNSGLQGDSANEKRGLYGYNLQTDTLLEMALRRGNASSFTTLTTLPAATFAFGDVLRLEAKINPGDVTLTVKQNGNIIATVVDNVAARIVTGSPGWMMNTFQGATAGENITNQWRNFRGGLL